MAAGLPGLPPEKAPGHPPQQVRQQRGPGSIAYRGSSDCRILIVPTNSSQPRGGLAELYHRLKPLFRDRPYLGWFARWPDFEAAAKSLRWFEPLVVPGLLLAETWNTLISEAMSRTESLKFMEEAEKQWM